MTEKRLYIIDGHSQLFRAYYAIRHLSNSQGVPTNAIYGFIQMLNKLLREENPEYIVVIFDAPGPSFRKEIYEQYKANRPEAPPDLKIQLEWVKKILDAMKISRLEIPGVEADDVIGTLATRASSYDKNVVIVSSDKDLLQLIDDRITLYRQHHDTFTIYNTDMVKNDLGVTPERVVDLMALQGDATDNIPGVPGIGPKTAAKLLQQFDSLDNLYDNLEKVDNKRWKEQLASHKEQAFISRELSVIKTDVSLDDEIGMKGFDIAKFQREKEINPELYNIYRYLEFGTLLKNKVQQRSNDKSSTYIIVQDIEILNALIEKLSGADTISIDTETTSTDPMRADLVGISVSIEPNTAYYIPVGHTPDLLSSSVQQIDRKTVMSALRPVLEAEHIKKTAHNMKYDIKILARHGIQVHGIHFDTMVASYILYPDRRNHNLKDIARDYLGIQMTPIENLIGKGKQALTMAQVEIKEAGDYACRDADITLQLTHFLFDELKKAELWDLFATMEIPLISVLNDMEMAGIAINKDHFHALSLEMDRRLAELATSIYDTAGLEFNINSSRQVADILFNTLKLKPLKSGKTGYSTDVSVLEALKDKHPLPGLLLEFRMYEKLKNTYIDTLPAIVNPNTGKIHTTYNQSVAATGRLISSDPNLQNIPIRTPLGREIRAGFVPSQPGWLLLSADYSQIELRILADLSNDPELITAFNGGRDIHRLTAAKVFNCPEDSVTGEMRDQAKIINFGIIYGMGPQRLSKELCITLKQADAFIRDYFRVYTGVKTWIDNTIEQARSTGFVTTLLHRRRFIPDITSHNPAMRSAAERVAINTPVQGTAADLIKKAMLNIHTAFLKSRLQTRMILQVHDELVFESPREEQNEVENLVRYHMEHALQLKVPIKVDLKSGNNWAEC